MSVNLERGATFLGVPLVTVRNVLRAWRHGDRSDLWRIAERKDVGLDPRTVFVLLEELRDRGLIGPEEQEYGPPREGLTEDGLALAGADARRRTPKVQAQRILDRFLDACAALNARGDLPSFVREVWLFGSMLDPARADVADVDLVVIHGLAPGYGSDMARARFREIAQGMGYEARSFIEGLFGHEAFVHRQILHGGRRHPLLSMHDLDELRDLGAPCRLIFDAGRGGRVSDDPLLRHPVSPGRSNRIGEKRRMPDLAAGRGPLRPLQVAAMQARSIWRPMMRALGPWRAGDVSYGLIDGVSMPRFVAEGIDPPDLKPNALSRRMRFAGCDGRDRAGLYLVEGRLAVPGDWGSAYETIPRAAAVIERTLVQTGRSVAYRLNLVEADYLGQWPDYEQLLTLRWWLHLVLTADVERIVRREIEDGAALDVSVTVAVSAGRRLAGGLAYQRGLFRRPYVKEARVRLGARAAEPRAPRGKAPSPVQSAEP